MAECKWQQRSSARWIKLGDNNTKYFHAIVSTRRKNNYISQLQDPQTQTTMQDPIEIIHTFSTYYKEILRTSSLTHTSDDWVQRVLPHQNLTGLTMPFNEHEIKNAVFHLAKGKSVGADGFLIEFFQKYWDVISKDIIGRNQDFYDNKVDLWRINKAHITLIPKKQGSTRLENFRPISVISSIPKIITKLLANRLCSYLLELVSPNQAAFVLNQRISETFVAARQTLSFLHHNKVPSVLLKIDFKKIFDTISWDYLMKLWWQKVLRADGSHG
jgi:Reverse transcriptase (RNA-dependent DNA polymerase)